ncbi:MAG: cysteine desulfurase [Alphaproteobacteria bacterium]|nr:cysteine desulfurase [Alphaproteobacteria bacterium]
MFACTKPKSFDAEKYRADFPALHQNINGVPLVFLDNAASAQKPTQVLESLTRLYSNNYANIHRGVYTLSQRATDAFEHARETVRRFINAKSSDEIVFTRGATESINLVAHSWGRTFLKSGDEVLVTELEHHANIVPWQILEKEVGIVLKPVRIEDNGDVKIENVKAAISPRTKLISVAHVSNALGTILPVEAIIAEAKSKNIPVLLDGCQAISHMPVDVQALGCDFYVFSSHKLYGPTGVGVLWGKKDILNKMPPYQTGGDMIDVVSFKGTTFRNTPHRFEAGTPAIAEVVGLGSAIEYVSTIGLSRIAEYENELLEYATSQLSKINSLRIIGTAPNKASIISFVMQNAHPHDIGTILDGSGIAVRVGHHCAQPVMERLGIPATTRASFAFYNTFAEVDALVIGIKKVQEIFG